MSGAVNLNLSIDLGFDPGDDGSNVGGEVSSGECDNAGSVIAAGAVAAGGVVTDNGRS